MITKLKTAMQRMSDYELYSYRNGLQSEIDAHCHLRDVCSHFFRPEKLASLAEREELVNDQLKNRGLKTFTMYYPKKELNGS